MVSPEIFSSEPSPERLAPHGLLVLLTGPTGVGKDTVLNNLNLSHQRIITHTSRPCGLNEREGVDYHFVSKEKFEEMIEAGQFLEFYENPRGDFYGTSREEIETKRKNNLTIWRFNPDGVFNVLDSPEKRTNLQPLVVICLVAELSVLAQRVKERQREKGWEVIERAKQASIELKSIRKNFLETREKQDREEKDMIDRRLMAADYEGIMFHNGHGWTNEFSPKLEDRIAVRLIENREGLRTFNGLPRTLGLVEETIRKMAEIWHLPSPNTA